MYGCYACGETLTDNNLGAYCEDELCPGYETPLVRCPRCEPRSAGNCRSTCPPAGWFLLYFIPAESGLVAEGATVTWLGPNEKTVRVTVPITDPDSLVLRPIECLGPLLNEHLSKVSDDVATP